MSIDGVCSSYSLATNGYLFNYIDASFEYLTEVLNQVETLFHNTGPTCYNITLTYACNVLFVPCDLTSGTPIAMCSNSCKQFKTSCSVEYETVARGLSVIDKFVSDICSDTLVYIKTRFAVNTTSKGVESNCLGMYLMHSCLCACCVCTCVYIHMCACVPVYLPNLYCLHSPEVYFYCCKYVTQSDKQGLINVENL